MKPKLTYLHLILPVVVLTMVACASIGRPEGGPRDETPPEFVRSNPMPGEKNVKRTRYDLYFNENIQLEDAFNKVVVSPVQQTPPNVSANGRHLTVELRDTLVPNATYTIDFADAIKDLNEGNILDGFALDFSTGDSIDSLRISGMVLQARNLEPAQGIYVGIYSDLSDTAITTKPFDRIARTNQYGQFTIRNLKPGSYRIFALNDLNRDFHWDRSEDVAFYDELITPYAEDFTVTDTLLTPDGRDSLIQRPGVKFRPNDVLLTWFNEDYKPQYMRDHGRPERHRLTFEFAAPVDTLPELTIADGPMAGAPAEQWAMLQKNLTQDTLAYWISDSAVIRTDSLRLAVRYQRIDTANMLSWTTDTMRFYFRDRQEKKKKESKEPLFRVTEEGDTIWPAPKIDYMGFSALSSSSQDLHLPVRFEAEHPIINIDSAGYRLEMQQDTLWLPVAGARLEVDSLNPLRRRVLSMAWQEGEHYRFIVDSAAVVGLYGRYNKEFKHEFTAKKPEDYTSLSLTLTGVDSPAVVELLNGSDEAVRTAPVVDGRAEFKYLNPGQYYLRLYFDRNENGIWDTGRLLDSVQPEEVFYFSKKLDLKKNWDVEQTWDIYELAVDQQKPYALIKNKPKLKRGETDPRDRKEVQYDEWGEPIEDDDMYGTTNNRSKGRTGTNRNSNSNNFGNSLGGVRSLGF